MFDVEEADEVEVVDACENLRIQPDIHIPPNEVCVMPLLLLRDRPNGCDRNSEKQCTRYILVVKVVCLVYVCKNLRMCIQIPGTRSSYKLPNTHPGMDEEGLTSVACLDFSIWRANFKEAGVPLELMRPSHLLSQNAGTQEGGFHFPGELVSPQWVSFGPLWAGFSLKNLLVYGYDNITEGEVLTHQKFLGSE